MFIFFNRTLQNHSTKLTEAGIGVFHLTKHIYVYIYMYFAAMQKRENFWLGYIHSWSTEIYKQLYNVLYIIYLKDKSFLTELNDITKIYFLFS